MERGSRAMLSLRRPRVREPTNVNGRITLKVQIEIYLQEDENKANSPGNDSTRQSKLTMNQYPAFCNNFRASPGVRVTAMPRVSRQMAIGTAHIQKPRKNPGGENGKKQNYLSPPRKKYP